MPHFVAYILQFQEIIVYKIHPGGRGSIASLRSNRAHSDSQPSVSVDFLRVVQPCVFAISTREYTY